MILEIELAREKVSDQLRKYQEYCPKKVPQFLFFNDSHVVPEPTSCKVDGALRQFSFAKPMGKVLKGSVSEGTRV